jgi:hypothetical protein
MQERAKLAAIETSDVQMRTIINESFLAGFRVVTLTAAGLGVAAALSAAVTMKQEAEQN